MKLFKSFDEFVNESFVTEAKDSFKLKTDKPDQNLGEVAVFKLVLREFDPQASLPQIAVSSSLAHPEFKKFADDTTLIAFMDIAKERDPGFLTPRDLLKGAIIFKKLEGFDKTKATPLVKVGNFEVFDAKSAAQMKAGDKTAEEIKKDVEEIKKDSELLPPKPEEKTNANPEYVDVEKIVADADVIAFLKSKLLNGGDAVKFSKNSKKIVEIKATQTLVSKFKRADKKTDTAAAAKVKKSGIDGIYGGGTSESLGMLTADNKPKDSITSDLITDIAKWCKLNGLDKPAVEKIFNEAKIEDGDNVKPNPDVAGAKYYFVNKGWTYSEQTDPYKK